MSQNYEFTTEHLGVSYLRKRPLVADADTDSNANSIATQRQAVATKADAMNVRIVGEFVDLDLSTRSLEPRPAFHQLLAFLAEHPEVNYVVVHGLSRILGRKYADAALTIRHLNKHGVRIVSTKEAFDEGTWASPRIMPALISFNTIRDQPEPRIQDHNR